MPLGAAKAAFLGAAGGGVAVPGAFECIAKETVSGGSTTSVEFTSIPASTYDNIEIVITWVPTTTGTASNNWTLQVYTNGVNSNDYGAAYVRIRGYSGDTEPYTYGTMTGSDGAWMSRVATNGNGMFSKVRFSNINTADRRSFNAISGCGVPSLPLGSAGHNGYGENMFVSSDTSPGALSSVKFEEDSGYYIEDGTTFTMMGIKSS